MPIRIVPDIVSKGKAGKRKTTPVKWATDRVRGGAKKGKAGKAKTQWFNKGGRTGKASGGRTGKQFGGGFNQPLGGVGARPLGGVRAPVRPMGFKHGKSAKKK